MTAREELYVAFVAAMQDGNWHMTADEDHVKATAMVDAAIHEALHAVVEARVVRDRYAALLAEASEALRLVGKAAIVVEPFLAKPYPDAPNTSPWERFMERPARRAYNLGHRIRRELNQASKEQP